MNEIFHEVVGKVLYSAGQSLPELFPSTFGEIVPNVTIALISTMVCDLKESFCSSTIY